MATLTPHRLDVAPFTESNLCELGDEENWPELRRILAQMPGNVTDGCLQSIVDDTRRRFDLCLGGVPDKLSALHNVANEDDRVEGAALLLELLLSIGVDPDLSTRDGWRPSHICAHLGCLRATRAILLCRPDMAAKNPNGDTPLGAAACTSYDDEEKAPYRVAGREDVARFIRSERLHRCYKTLPELAVRKFWFAVKNLIRRQVVPASEFEQKAYGKTAVEWAEFSNEKGIAAELRYYASHASAKLLDADQRIKDMDKKVKSLEGQLATKQKTISTLKEKALAEKDAALAEKDAALAEKDAAVAEAMVESEELKKQLKSLEERCAAHEKKNVELAETVAALSARLPDREDSHQEIADGEPGAKRPKLETADSALESGEDEQSAVKVWDG